MMRLWVIEFIFIGIEFKDLTAFHIETDIFKHVTFQESVLDIDPY